MKVYKNLILRGFHLAISYPAVGVVNEFGSGLLHLLALQLKRFLLLVTRL
jgi:hypothetical protein